MIVINEFDFICRNNKYEAGHVYNTLIYRQQFNKCFYIENTSEKLSSEGLEKTKIRPLTYSELKKIINLFETFTFLKFLSHGLFHFHQSWTIIGKL